MIRIRLDSLGADGITIDVQVGVIHGIVFISPGGNGTEWCWVKEFPPPESGLEQIAIALTAVNAATADTRLGSHIS